MAFAILSIGSFLFGVVTTTSIMLLENLQTSDEGLEVALVCGQTGVESLRAFCIRFSLCRHD